MFQSPAGPSAHPASAASPTRHPSLPAPDEKFVRNQCDAHLRTRVLDRLGDLGQKFPIRIQVDINQGKVRLQGRVASNSQKLIIMHVIQSLEGVQQVHDGMVVGHRLPGNEIAELASHSGQHRWVFGLGGMLCILLLAGVWGWWTMPPAARPLQARVTFEGKPPVGATVTLHPRRANVEVFPYGAVQSDGLVLWAGSGPEVPLSIGKYAATVTWNRLIGGGDQMQCGPNLLPPHYARRETSPLVIAVTKNASQSIQFELKK